MLKKWYSNNDYTDGFIQRVQLYSTKYSGSSAEDFIMSWKSRIKRLWQCEFPYVPIDAAMMFTTVIPQSGTLWIELHCKVNAASRAGEIDDTWLDHFFQAMETDAKVDALSNNVQSKVSTSSASTNLGKRSTPHKACKQCTQSSTSVVLFVHSVAMTIVIICTVVVLSPRSWTWMSPLIATTLCLL